MNPSGYTYPRASYVGRCSTVALFIGTTDKYFVNFKALKNIYILKLLLYRHILEIVNIGNIKVIIFNPC